VDLMQLVRVIEVGVDLDGDGTPDLDPSRTYYFGSSFGGMYGTVFLAFEPSVRAGVPNVPGGPDVEVYRLSVSLAFGPATVAGSATSWPRVSRGSSIRPALRRSMESRPVVLSSMKTCRYGTASRSRYA
jgi:hypothetical protein